MKANSDGGMKTVIYARYSDDKRAVLDLYSQGHSLKEIAQMLNAEASPSPGVAAGPGESPSDPENGPEDGSK